MRTTVIAAAFSSLLLSSCGSPVANLPDPTMEEGGKAVGALLRAGPFGFSSRVNQAPSQCSKGKIGETEVVTCKVCAITMYRIVDTPNIATLKREVFDVAFRRAQSFELPEVSPADPKSGVWAAVVPATPQYSSPNIPRQELASVDVVGQVASDLLGVTGQNNGWYWSYLLNGQRLSNDQAFRMLADLPDQRLQDMVGACTAP